MIGRTLSHFKLLAKLGEGGMGIVYRAEDEALRRPVALKVLSGRLLEQPEHRLRFLREARAAAAVTHPSVATIYEVGEAEGVVFIAMELVEGKTLRELQGGKALPVKQAVRIAGEVAEAIVAAHASGVIHRDLKPDNIIVGRDGRAKVLDFGLAKLMQEAVGPGELPSQADTISGELTRAGKVLGTASYMSPEQARGEKLDARSDLFSFGVTLYEMVTGWPPFRGKTTTDVLSAIIRDPALPASHVNPDVPAELDRILAACLEKDPAERYQHTDQLAVDLRRLRRLTESAEQAVSTPAATTGARLRPGRAAWRWIAAAMVVVGLLAAGCWFLLTGARNSVDSHTVLILPMEVHGQDDGSEYVGRAFAEAIAVQLAQTKALSILPVPQKNELPGSGTRERAATAVRLGAGRLVTGSLYRDGNAIHASLSLVDAARNRILWGMEKDDADGSFSGLAAVYAEGIRTELGITSARLYEYPLYMTGRGAMATAPETAAVMGALRRYEIQPALDATKRLVEAFPGDPDALALRAYAIFRADGTALVSSTALEEALQAAERVDPQSAAVRNIRCEVLLFKKEKFEEGSRCADGLIFRNDLTPAARAWALRDRGAAKSSLGDPAGALQDIHAASELDPTNHFNFQMLGLLRKEASDWDGAVVAFSQCTALVPGYGLCHSLLAEALHRAGRSGEALSESRKGCEIDQTRGECAYHAFFLAKAGHADDAESALRNAATIPGQGADGAYEFARAWLAMGDRLEALQSLRVFATSPSALGANPDEDPDFASLHGDREFKTILEEQRAFVARARAAGSKGND